MIDSISTIIWLNYKICYHYFRPGLAVLLRVVSCLKGSSPCALQVYGTGVPSQQVTFKCPKENVFEGKSIWLRTNRRILFLKKVLKEMDWSQRCSLLFPAISRQRPVNLWGYETILISLANDRPLSVIQWKKDPKPQNIVVVSSIAFSSHIYPQHTSV